MTFFTFYLCILLIIDLSMQYLMKSCFRGESGGAEDDRSQEEGGGTVQRTVEDQRTGDTHF